MFKLVVLSVVVAIAAAKPGHLAYASHSVYDAPVLKEVIVPAAVSSAVSHSYRKDVISEPTLVAHAAPALAAYASPIVQEIVAPAAVSAAVSHTHRKDVVNKPVVSAYAAPAVFAAPVVQKLVARVPVPAAVSHSYRKDIIRNPLVSSYYAAPVHVSHSAVVAAPALAYAAHSPVVHGW